MVCLHHCSWRNAILRRCPSPCVPSGTWAWAVIATLQATVTVTAWSAPTGVVVAALVFTTRFLAAIALTSVARGWPGGRPFGQLCLQHELAPAYLPISGPIRRACFQVLPPSMETSTSDGVHARRRPRLTPHQAGRPGIAVPGMGLLIQDLTLISCTEGWLGSPLAAGGRDAVAVDMMRASAFL